VGPAGPQGDAGPRGEIGPQGARGEIGPQGLKGERGPSGKDGRDGVDGSTFAFGESSVLHPEDVARLRVVDMIDESGAVRRIVVLE
jgi:hypothetical protein